MESLIICKSSHHGNTKKIAKVMAEILGSAIVEPREITDLDVLKVYDLIGFGSGIYGHRHQSDLLDLACRLPDLGYKKAFIFSTSWKGIGGAAKSHRVLRMKLMGKGLNVIGEFACKGFTTWGPFKLIRGVNKGKPDNEDLEGAKKFAAGLKNRIKK